MPTDTSTPSDADLIHLSAQGDKAAFSQLYDRFVKPLFSIAYKVVGNSAEAEDVVQDVFIELWSRASDFDEKRAQPFTWAVTITRNKSVDRLRMRGRRGAIRERAAEDIADFSLGTTEVDSRDSAWFNESAEILREAFAKLPNEQRSAIELAYYGGLTQTEIAEKLSQPLGTIKARIRRGLLKLREQLAGKL